VYLHKYNNEMKIIASDKIKVVYFLPTKSMYGDNIALLNIMPLLCKLGIEPLFLVQKLGDVTDELEKRNYRYIIYPFYYPNLSPPLNSLKSILSFIKLKLLQMYREKNVWNNVLKDIADFDPAFVHSNNSCSLVGFYIAQKLKRNHIWHIREFGKLDIGRNHFPSKSAFIKRTTQAFNYSITITDQIKKYFQNQQNACVIYDGVVSINDQRKLRINWDKHKYFLFVGRITPTKGLEQVITAFYKSRTDYELWIAGDGDDEYISKLKSQIAKYGLSNKVVFLGYKADVADLMSNAAALIVASKFEAFGFITAEAMYNGCLVIGHNVGGTKMQFDNGYSLFNNEIGLRYTTLNELANHLSIVSNQGIEIYRGVIINAQKCVPKLYSQEVSAHKVYNLYADILYNTDKLTKT
jgi:glycosyltransferase involved in cell wall biosynthesis